MSVAPSQLTPEQWKRVEDALRFAHASVELECDGFKLSLRVAHIKPLKLGICFYVNGRLRGEWWLNDCEERRRFMRPLVLRNYSHAKKAAIIKRMGKKYAAEFYGDLDATRTIWDITWLSAAPLKRHLVKHNASIHLVSINGVEEPQA